MKKQITKDVLLVIAGLLAAGVLLRYLKVELIADRPRENLATLVLQFSDERKRVFQGAVVEGMTVLDALNSSSLGGGFEFKFWVDTAGQVNLIALGGEPSQLGQGGWHFYLNRDPIDIANINLIGIKEDDIIEARFER